VGSPERWPCAHRCVGAACVARADQIARSNREQRAGVPARPPPLFLRLPQARLAAIWPYVDRAAGLNSGRILVLVSEDIEHDRRVLASLAHYPAVEIINLASADPAAFPPFSLLACLRAVLMVLKAIQRGHGLWSLLREQYGLSPDHLFAGCSVSLRSFVRALRVASGLRQRLNGVQLIHAHDLFCGVVGLELARSSRAALIYDAHEIEFHRNRRNSWLRTAFDVVVENAVLSRASELRVVNVPIADLYEQVHGMSPERVRVLPNDHFASRLRPADAAVPSAEELALVYVGGGVRGRQLDHLAAETKRLGVPVYAFFIGEVPDVAIAAGWVLGPRDYESALVSLVASRRCVMWCCVDDVCLSYRLSLPNKFFQALAVGIPVVAADRTYLADLVGTHGLGFIFDGHNFESIVRGIQGRSFADALASVRRFRLAVTTGLLRI